MRLFGEEFILQSYQHWLTFLLIHCQPVIYFSEVLMRRVSTKVYFEDIDFHIEKELMKAKFRLPDNLGSGTSEG